MTGRVRKFWRSGEPFIWLTGGALAVALIMVVGLIGVILSNALGFFWPADVIRLTLRDGKSLAGSIVDRERIPGTSGQERIKVKAVAPVLTVLRAPKHVARSARSVTLRVATSLPARLTLGGRRYALDTKPRAIRVKAGSAKVLRGTLRAGAKRTAVTVTLARR